MKSIPYHEVPLFAEMVSRYGPDILAAEDLIDELGAEEFEAWDDLYIEHAFELPPMPLSLLVQRMNALTTQTQVMEVLTS